MDFNKDNYFTKNIDKISDIKLYKLISYFPWKEWCDTQDFAMPYPEIIALSDYAHAMYTQITGLLLDYTSSFSNSVRVDYKVDENDIRVTYLYIYVEMNDVSDVWEYIGINNEDLRGYTALMVRNYIEKEILKGLDYEIEQKDCYKYRVCVNFN